jgi:hypothetical protein
MVPDQAQIFDIVFLLLGEVRAYELLDHFQIAWALGIQIAIRPMQRLGRT